MQRYHVRLIATLDRYIEATGPEQAEQMAIERCRGALQGCCRALRLPCSVPQVLRSTLG